MSSRALTRIVDTVSCSRGTDFGEVRDDAVEDDSIAPGFEGEEQVHPWRPST
jgi:hypothetical protein